MRIGVDFIVEVETPNADGYTGSFCDRGVAVNVKSALSDDSGNTGWVGHGDTEGLLDHCRAIWESLWVRFGACKQFLTKAFIAGQIDQWP